MTSWRQVNSSSFVQIETLRPLLDQPRVSSSGQAIEVTVAKPHDREMHIRRAVSCAHAAGELIADGDPRAYQIRLIDVIAPCCRQSGHQRLPGEPADYVPEWRGRSRPIGIVERAAYSARPVLS